MKYELHALSIYEVGQRKDKDGNPHQEDYIFPKKDQNNDNNRLFILCDGLGGHSNGELASRTVCDTISQSIKKGDESHFTDDIFLKALDKAYDKLDELDENPESQRKMGTTLTFLMLHENGATIAHIGDSRVYQIRPNLGNSNDVVFRTKDHSLINDLIKIGELKPENAKNYPYKNVITRAIQPNMEERAQADIYHTKDICPGDYFFMCSDGMLELMENDDFLCSILIEKKTDEEKVETLTQITKENKDNHSAHLIHILDVQQKHETNERNIFNNKTDVNKKDDFFFSRNKKQYKNLRKSDKTFFTLLLCSLFFAIILFISYTKKTNKIEKISNFLHHNEIPFYRGTKTTSKELYKTGINSTYKNKDNLNLKQDSTINLNPNN